MPEPLLAVSGADRRPPQESLFDQPNTTKFAIGVLLLEPDPKALKNHRLKAGRCLPIRRPPLKRKSGAGEGIRTLDPNLGNVPEGSTPAYPVVRHTALTY